nr:hypothetical protein NG677_10925 [Methylobacterium sp. OTU13CASTA1]
MRMRLFGCGLALLMVAGLGGAARAQWTMRPLESPLPEQLKVRAEALVRTLRPHDADESVAHLRTIEDAASHPEVVLLRVEADCRLGRCMTVLARDEAAGMVPELILQVGPAMIVGDLFSSLWGVPTEPGFLFEGDGDNTLVVIRRGAMWVVSACNACIVWHAQKAPSPPRTVSPPVPPPPLLTFEDFRTFLRR